MAKDKSPNKHGDRTDRAKAPSFEPVANPYRMAVLAWVLPGLGHVLLGRWRRGLAFFGLVAFALSFGMYLDGLLPTQLGGQPLQSLATLGCMGMGLPYFFARFVLEYSGTVTAVGFEYGKAFILSAGLMNLLLVLDAWDIASGKKE